MQPRVAIVILNWNGWADTIECLDSIFRNDYSNYQVIICDNASEDNSVAIIHDWCKSKLNLKPFREHNNPLLQGTSCTKFEQFIIIDQEEAETGNISGADKAKVIFICNSRNLGFAAGNNVGISLALSITEIEYVWLLNNDTQVDQNSLIALVSKMQKDKRIGICGSVICDYEDRGKVQTLGGIFNRWLGTVRSVGTGIDIDELRQLKEKSDFHIDYPVGASLLLSRRFLLEVGLMSEDYFLYFEELDWVTRTGKRFDVSVCLDSLVYHKEGASIGTNHIPNRRSLKSDFYVLRNRLVFAKKFFPYSLPTVWMALHLSAFNRMRRKQWRAAWMTLLIAWTGGRTNFNTK